MVISVSDQNNERVTKIASRFTQLSRKIIANEMSFTKNVEQLQACTVLYWSIRQAAAPALHHLRIERCSVVQSQNLFGCHPWQMGISLTETKTKMRVC